MSKTFEMFWAGRPADILDPKSDHERTWRAAVIEADERVKEFKVELHTALMAIGAVSTAVPGLDIKGRSNWELAMLVLRQVDLKNAEIKRLMTFEEDSKLLDWLEGHPYPAISPDGKAGYAFAIAGDKGVPMRSMIKAAMKAEQEANATNKDLN